MALRKSRRANFIRGRIWLVGLFLLLRGLDCFRYFAAAEKRTVLASILIGTLWSVVLLGIIWQRKDWARYAMVVLLLFSVGLQFIAEVSFAEYVGNDVILVMATNTIGQLTVALILIFSPTIQKLTSKAYA